MNDDDIAYGLGVVAVAAGLKPCAGMAVFLEGQKLPGMYINRRGSVVAMDGYTGEPDYGDPPVPDVRDPGTQGHMLAEIERRVQLPCFLRVRWPHMEVMAVGSLEPVGAVAFEAHRAFDLEYYSELKILALLAALRKTKTALHGAPV